MSPNPGDLCLVEWDDRDDPTIPRGIGWTCQLPEGHDGPHKDWPAIHPVQQDFTWE